MSWPFLWILFALSVGAMLGLDLGLHRKMDSTSLRSALAWSVGWISLAGVFAAALYFRHGRVPALEFVTAYVIELSLSVDNLFIFLLIFQHFGVTPRPQHKVLFWGIVGAVIMRGIFIVAGVGLLRRFEWLIYLFGAFLIYSGVNLLIRDRSQIDPDKTWIVRMSRRLLPITDDYEGSSFFVRRSRVCGTPLLIVLLLIESTDLLFATDSIPAVLAITTNALIVFTSNIFAILGLRSMYFALAGVMEKFHYLHYGLSTILVFVGAKMVLSHYYAISTPLSLAIVAAILAVSVGVSLFDPAAHPSKRSHSK